MKTLITLLLIACGFIASAQSPSEKYSVPFIGYRSESTNMVGGTFKNTNLAEKAGIILIVGNDTGWVWIDTLTGRFNFYPGLGSSVLGADSSLWKLGAGTNSIMDKRSISSTGDESTTIGTDATNSGDFSLVFGYNSSNSNNFSLVVGDDNVNSGLNGVVVGDGNNNSGAYGVLIGSGGINTFSKSIGLGANVTTTKANQLYVSDSITEVYSNAYFVSGVSKVYTPTLTNTTNVTSSTARQCTWAIDDSVVTVFCNLDVTTTLAVATEIQLSLPPGATSNLATAFDLNGIGSASSAVATNVFLNGDNTTDRARLQFIGLSVGGAGTIYFSFQYVVK